MTTIYYGALISIAPPPETKHFSGRDIFDPDNPETYPTTTDEWCNLRETNNYRIYLAEWNSGKSNENKYIEDKEPHEEFFLEFWELFTTSYLRKIEEQKLKFYMPRGIVDDTTTFLGVAVSRIKRGFVGSDLTSIKTFDPEPIRKKLLDMGVPGQHIGFYSS